MFPDRNILFFVVLPVFILLLFSTTTKTMMLKSVYNIFVSNSNLGMNPWKFNRLLVSKITRLSHDSKLFEISFPHKHQELGETCNYVSIKAPGVFKPRKYSPVSINNQKGFFELLIRHYPDGRVSKYMNEVKEGDCIQVNGPTPKFPYTPNMKRRIGMLAGGTGIAPMIQLLREIVSNPLDLTEVSVLYSDRRPEDLLMREQLDEMAREYPRIRVSYTVTGTHFTPPWTGLTGRINPRMIKDVMPPPAEDTLILVCGSKSFVKDTTGSKTVFKGQSKVSGHLQELGYSSDMVFKF